MLGGWAVKRLGERLRAGPRGTVSTVDIVATLDGCFDAVIVARHASTLLHHAGYSGISALAVALHDVCLPEHIQLALLIAVLRQRASCKHSTGDGGAASVRTSLKLLAELVQPGTSCGINHDVSTVCQSLRERLRTLTLPAWTAEDISTQEAVVSFMMHGRAQLNCWSYDRGSSVQLATINDLSVHWRSTDVFAVDNTHIPHASCQFVFTSAFHQLTLSLPACHHLSLSIRELVVQLSLTTMVGGGWQSVYCLECAARTLLTPSIRAYWQPRDLADAYCRIAQQSTVMVHSARASACVSALYTCTRTWACSCAPCTCACCADADVALCLIGSVLVLMADAPLEANGRNVDAAEVLPQLVETLTVMQTALPSVDRRLFRRPFRLPRCTAKAQHSYAPARSCRYPACPCTIDPRASASNWRGRLGGNHQAGRRLRCQWDHVAHAVLETLMRTAVRSSRGGMQHFVERLVASVHGSCGAADLFERVAHAVLRRHIRSRRSVKLEQSSCDDRSVIIAALCSSLDRARRTRLMASAFLFAADSQNGSNAEHFDGQMHFLSMLLQDGEEVV